MPEVISVTKQIEHACEKFCNNYCKYPEKYSAEEWETKMDEICDKCILNELI